MLELFVAGMILLSTPAGGLSPLNIQLTDVCYENGAHPDVEALKVTYKQDGADTYITKIRVELAEDSYIHEGRLIRDIGGGPGTRLARFGDKVGNTIHINRTFSSWVDKNFAIVLTTPGEDADEDDWEDDVDVEVIRFSIVNNRELVWLDDGRTPTPVINSKRECTG